MVVFSPYISATSLVSKTIRRVRKCGNPNEVYMYHHIAGLFFLSRKEKQYLYNPPKLCLIEPVVFSLFCHEFVMVSGFTDFSMVNYENTVCIFNSRETMGNDKGSSSFQKTFDSLLYQNLCPGIDA